VSTPTPQTHTMMKAWFDRMLFPLTRPGRAVKALESSPPDRLQATVLHCMATQDLSSLRPDDQFSEALAAARTRLTAWFDEGDALQVQCRVTWRNECPDGCVLEHINMTLGQRMSVEWLKRQLVREATLRVAKTSSAERSELAACVMASEDVEVALGGCPLGDDAQMLQDLEVETEATLEVVIDYEALRSKVDARPDTQQHITVTTPVSVAVLIVLLSGGNHRSEQKARGRSRGRKAAEEGRTREKGKRKGREKKDRATAAEGERRRSAETRGPEVGCGNPTSAAIHCFQKPSANCDCPLRILICEVLASLLFPL